MKDVGYRLVMKSASFRWVAVTGIPSMTGALKLAALANDLTKRSRTRGEGFVVQRADAGPGDEDVVGRQKRRRVVKRRA